MLKFNQEKTAIVRYLSDTEVIIPEGVKHIKNSAFKNCTLLKKVILPKSLISIEESAFEGCKSLIEIVLPENVTSIGEKAFYSCDSLKKGYPF